MPKMEATLAAPSRAAAAASEAADAAARRLTLDERFEREALPHMRSLYSTAYRLTRNAADAEDLVQEAFLRAYRAFEGYTPDTNIRAWLYTILYRVRADHYRRIGRSIQTVELEGDGPATAAPQDTLARGQEDVARALAELPECFRGAVVLRDIQEFSYEEIAAILDVPIGTVMSRIHRGRALLRRALSGRPL
ncbi:MAG TPA: sigma-70 family RNA polymerase sigma factor [Vicinamibacteria bacterium]|nr:sigma-70 family RNA polymerase sigma factor [Vicinamibacteria bacterium]